MLTKDVSMSEYNSPVKPTDKSDAITAMFKERTSTLKDPESLSEQSI